MAKIKTFNWQKVDAGFQAEMPDNVTLVATPDSTKGSFGEKPARGTAWRAQASHWNEATKTMSGFGRDEYSAKHASAKLAMQAAEKIYMDAFSLDTMLLTAMMHLR